VERVATKVVLHEIPGISRISILLNDKEGGERCLITDGVNIPGFYDLHDFIDLNNIYTNDIASVLRHYGVEAARNAIIKEVGGVFEVYGIGVDHRHLTLIADYMVSFS
jgi:DNA-directed RNA polymerase I subunit RPA1